MNKIRYLFILLLSTGLTGCLFTPIGSGIHGLEITAGEETGVYKMLTMQADKRMILTGVSVPPIGSTNATSYPIICAEPPPDGGVEITTEASLDLSSGQSQSPTIGISSNQGRNVTIPHSQHHIVKFYRDGIFALCQAVMNGLIETQLRNVDEKYQKKCGKNKCSEFEFALYKLREDTVEMVTRSKAEKAIAQIKAYDWFQTQLKELNTLIEYYKNKGDKLNQQRYQKAKDKLLGAETK